MKLSDFDFSPERMTVMLGRAEEMGNPKYTRVLTSMIEFQRTTERELTQAQKSFAASIYYSLGDIAMERFRNWKVKLANDEEYREKVRVICDYYLNTHYYRTTATLCKAFIEGKQTHLPDYSDFIRMMDNEYANNVWESHKAEPKFAIGDLVRLRANADVGFRHRQVDSWMVITIGNKPITKAHTYNEKLGGTKRYELLEVGGTMVTTVIEKHLKKHRVPKTKKRT